MRWAESSRGSIIETALIISCGAGVARISNREVIQVASRWRFKSVRTRQIFWFMIVALAPVVIAVTVLYHQRSAVIEGREFEKLQTIRDIKDRELNGWLEERMGDLQVAAGDYEIRGMESVFVNRRGKWTHAEFEAVVTARALLQRLVDNYDAYYELFLVGAHSGEVVISSDANHEWSQKGKDLYFTEVMRTRQPYIKDIYLSKEVGKPAMTFSAPVFCLEHKGTHLIGVMVARVDLEHSLYPMLQEHTSYGNTGETLIINRDVMALNELRWRKDAPLKLKISAQPAVRAAGGETGITETPDYRGEMVLAAYTHIPLTRWGFVAKRDLAEIYMPIRSMLWDMGIILIVSACIIFFIALALGRVVARPIIAIADTARCIREGNLNARCEVIGADETADLAVSFNDMADTVLSQLKVQGAGSDITSAAVAVTSVDDFATALVAKLMNFTGSNIGAFYQRNRNGLTFDLITSAGLKGDALSVFDVDIRKGGLGQALASRSISYTSGIADEAVFAFKTQAGIATPREIAIMPLLVGIRVIAVLSLATSDGYTQEHRQILDRVWVGLNTVLSNLMASEETLRISKELQLVNEELNATNEELQHQAEELNVQRKQIAEANRLKSEFLSNMSHELRTPLNSVMALSQLMISRGLGKDLEQEAEYLKVIERNGQQLLDLINDILDLSKIEAGRQELLLDDIDPGEVAAMALITVKPLADKKGLTTIFLAPDGLPAICSNRDKVRQILLNLLANAIKFTAHGSVELAVSQNDHGVLFSVTDTGLGIDGSDMTKIFDEFRQLDGSATRKHGGTGLGLSISRRLARLLGGDITVASELGAGSMFTLMLPQQCPAMASEAVALEKEWHSQTSKFATAFKGRPNILVVEGNETAAIQIRTALEDCGCEVTVAVDGAEGLSAVREAVPDAIVVDLMMPDIDGFFVLEQIRSVPDTEQLPVLVLTAKKLTAKEYARLRYNNVQELAQKGSLNREQLIEKIAELIMTQAETKWATPTNKNPAIHMLLESTVILIVEDNPDNQLIVAAILDEMGVGHITAEDGELAIQLAKGARPDLILMDIQLPVLSGLDATKRIKADPDLRRIPIIALTARAMAGDRDEILAAGCDGYVSKPIKPSTLSEVILKWLV